MIFYFCLGRENKISQKEIEAVLANFGFSFASDVVSILADDILEIKLNIGAGKIADLLKILGGTVKIYQKVAASLENIDQVILDCPEKSRRPDETSGVRDPDLKASGKIIFGISNYSKSEINTFRRALEIKKRLGRKRSIRVIAGKEDDRLSSAQSFQYRMADENLEFGLFDTPSRPARAEAGGVGRLIAVQNIDEWARRDYGKPRSDAASGMLPPKLARMMVNIALGQIRPIGPIRPICVDPFCGSGNILLEGLVLGCDVIGSDVSEKAVEDTEANLNWLIQNAKCKDHLPADATHQALQAGNDNAKFKISQADAIKFDFGEFDRDFIIVSEPYLGRPRNHKLTIEEEKEAMSGASKLYLDFLKNLKLTANSSQLKAVCIVFPLYELKNGKKLSIFDRCIDFICQIGYTLVCPPLEYGRDYQIVKREIIVFKFKA